MSEIERCQECGEVCPKALTKHMALGGKPPPQLAKLLGAQGQGMVVPVPMLPGGLFSLLGGVPFGDPKTAFLREPMYTKSRPLTTDELKKRLRADGKRAHHRTCRRLANPIPFLDYVSCAKCNVSLGEDDVFWKTYYMKKGKKRRGRRGGAREGRQY